MTSHAWWRSCLLALVVLALAAPAHAAPSSIDQTDPAGDVNVFDGGGTKPTIGQRRSIDLTRFRVSRDAENTRFTFTLARIVAGRTFDQIVEAEFAPRSHARETFVALANPQHRTATTLSGDTVCLLKVHTSRRSGTVRVDVPTDCIPQGQGVLRVSAYTQERNGSGPGFSEDTLRVRGLVTLR